ncbi:MAG: YlmC/YmxH family sporulation protein [Oscillospiraceae bacterium]|nr:YlmC/YmxH family sporulation protein [Oscillospiraceae bacterium]MBQ8732476.1 YlmC/YmxH family sporulation protein [Oscillospiraceae bacterium]
MLCSAGELYNRTVININDGKRVGTVSDLMVDTKTAIITALILPGKHKMMGILGREEDISIPWEQIRVFGKDSILVDLPLDE